MHQFVGRIEVGGVALGLRLGRRNAVVDDLLLEVDAAADAVGEGAARGSGRGELQLVDLAAAAGDLFRQRSDHNRLDGAAQFRLRGVQSDCVCYDLYRLVGGARSEPEVDGRGGTHFDGDAFLNGLFEAGGINRDRVFPGQETLERVSACAAGHRAIAGGCSVVDNFNSSVGNHGARWIGNGAGNSGARLCRRMLGMGKQEAGESENECECNR